MRVLFINETCGRGSHGTICTSLLDILHSEGHEAMIAYGRDSVPKEYKSYSIRIGNKMGVYIHAFISRIFDNAGFNSRLATQRLIKKIKDFNPDIIHLHNIHGYYIHVGVLFNYLSSCGKKIIWTLHDSWAYTGHCTCSDFIGCQKWVTGCKKCPQKKDYPSSVFIDRSKTNYLQKKQLFTSIENMQLVVPSEWLRRETLRSYMGKYPISVIKSGIDLQIFYPQESNFRQKYNLEGKKIVLSVANAWSKRKGLELLNNLAQSMEENSKLVLVGDLRGNIVNKHILCINHTQNQKELAQIYSAADVYLNLSYEETQGLTTIEALACGTPAVVSKHTAIPESVDERCGVIIEAETADSINAAILKAFKLNHKDCIRHAQSYEKKRCFWKYIELYKEIMSK